MPCQRDALYTAGVLLQYKERLNTLDILAANAPSKAYQNSVIKESQSITRFISSILDLGNSQVKNDKKEGIYVNGVRVDHG